MIYYCVSCSSIVIITTFSFCILRLFYLGLASAYPEPEDKETWLTEQLYNFSYESSMPVTWPWPKMPYVKTRKIIFEEYYSVDGERD